MISIWEMSVEVLETKRLVVRRLRPDDLDDFAALCADPELNRYMDDGRPLSREQTERWIEVSLANYRERGWGCFGVAAKPGDGLIGFAGFARPPERPGVVELIFAFGPDHWGRGYATEVAGALVEFGFKRCGLTQLEATVDPANGASGRVLAKVGFSYEGRGTEDDGSPVDYYIVEEGGITPANGPQEGSGLATGG